MSSTLSSRVTTHSPNACWSVRFEAYWLFAAVFRTFSPPIIKTWLTTPLFDAPYLMFLVSTSTRASGELLLQLFAISLDWHRNTKTRWPALSALQCVAMLSTDVKRPSIRLPGIQKEDFCRDSIQPAAVVWELFESSTTIIYPLVFSTELAFLWLGMISWAVSVGSFHWS